MNLHIGFQFPNCQKSKNKMEILKKILNISSKNLSTTKTDMTQSIDLGLPSGLKWAKCNVGAENETDYGDYFMWGDIKDKSNADCSWSSYIYGDGYEFSKYNTENGCCGIIDNKTTLDHKDDAARAYMGDKWRMPSKDEIEELVDNTDNEWITNYNGTAVNGMKFISKTDKSKYIFIPASGFRSASSFYSQGSCGSVWSSSLDASFPYVAWNLEFDSIGIRAYSDEYCSREYGLTVRGVID